MSRAETDLSGGDFAFLGFLAWGLDTAYAIKQAMVASISHFWTAAHSQVYSQAARLVRDGYVREREERSGRRRKLLSLTPRGRRALAAWLAEPGGAFELRDETLVKVFFAAEGDLPRTREVLEAKREEYRGMLAEYERIRDGLAAQHDAVRSQHALMTVSLGVRVVKAYLAWLDETIPRFPTADR